MDDDVHFTPEMVIAAVTESSGLLVEQLGVAPVVVLAWSVKLIRSLAETVGAVQSEHWMYQGRHPLYVGEVEGQSVTFAHVPVGAPGTVMMMEEMVAAGARAFWGFGAGGSLQEVAPVGTCIIPTSAISEEGTSQHYIEGGAALLPDARLMTILEESCREEGIAALTGPIWTTDAPYRETRAKIGTYRRQGVLGVEMETSAMYAFGQVRGVSVCNLLVVSDELWREWHFDGPAFANATRQAEKAILRSVARI
jgi:uridine phosphorylase